MGFLGTLEELGKSALREAGGELKKINVGKAIKRELQNQATAAAQAVASPLTRASQSAGGALQDLRDAAQGLASARYLPWILAGGFAVVVVLLWQRR